MSQKMFRTHRKNCNTLITTSPPASTRPVCDRLTPTNCPVLQRRESCNIHVHAYANQCVGREGFLAPSHASAISVQSVYLLMIFTKQKCGRSKKLSTQQRRIPSLIAGVSSLGSAKTLTKSGGTADAYRTLILLETRLTRCCLTRITIFSTCCGGGSLRSASQWRQGHN